MTEMWTIIVSHSIMVGVSEVFQCPGITVLTAVRKCHSIPFCILESMSGIMGSKAILGSLGMITP